MEAGGRGEQEKVNGKDEEQVELLSTGHAAPNDDRKGIRGETEGEIR